MPQIILENSGQRHTVDVAPGSPLDVVNGLHDDREEVGAPSSYTLAVNGTAQEAGYILKHGDVVTFRPKTGNKGCFGGKRKLPR